MACQGSALHGSGAVAAAAHAREATREVNRDMEEASQAMSERLAESIGRSTGSDEAAIRRRRVAAILRAVENQVVPRLLSAHARRPGLLTTPRLLTPPELLTPGGTGPSTLQADSMAPGRAAVPSGPGSPAGSGGGADGGGPGGAVARARVTQEAVLALAAALLGPDPATGAAACVARCRAEGVPVEAICLDLLSGTARHLGDLWVEDRCSFTEVTLAAVHLHRLLHAMALGVDPVGRDADSEAPPPAGLALLVAAPGEQHSLGLSMLSDFFRGAGWQVQNPVVSGPADSARVVAARPVDLIGFSLGAEVHLPRLAPCVAAVRRASRNRDIIVMVGGPAFLDRPELAIRLGADDTARDATEALARAAALLAARRRPAAGRRVSGTRAR